MEGIGPHTARACEGSRKLDSCHVSPLALQTALACRPAGASVLELAEQLLETLRLFLLASRGWTAAAINGLCGFGGFYWCVRARTSVRVRVHVVRERCLPFVAER